MKRFSAIFAATSIAMLGAAAQAEPRLALVVGVSEYGPNKLTNASNDASLIAKALESAGFNKPVLLDNPSKLQIERAVDDLASRAEKLGRDTTIVVYFAGHGMKVLDRDYLIPPGTMLLDGPANVRDFRREAIDAETVLATLGEVSSGRVIFILDACRLRPAPRDERAAPSARDAGLAEVMNIPNGPDTLIFFAAEPGQVAYDGAGRPNGYFATALSDTIRKPGLQLSELVTNVREQVWRETNHRQRPYPQGGGFRFTFVEAPPTAPRPEASNDSGDDATWRIAQRRNNDQSYAMYLDLYPAGRHAGEARGAAASPGSGPAPSPQALPNKAAALMALQTITKDEWRSAARQTIATKVITATTLRDLEALANDGEPRAQFVLATLYEYGAGGVTQNIATATGLFQTAADANLAAAQFVIGDNAYFGINGATKDSAKARDLFLKAAKDGHVASASRLGDIYQGYTDLPKDDVLARKYVVFAAEHGEPWAQCRLGVIYDQGRLGLAKSPDKARDFTERSAKQGNYCGQVNLGGMYMYGTGGLKKDPQKGFELFKQAAESNMPVPLRILGSVYENGDGVAKNPALAAHFYELAAQKGEIFAQERTGLYYREGIGHEKDPQASIRWFEAAAAQNAPWAQHQLGIAYLYGQGVAPDPHRAAELFEKSAAQGNGYAQSAAGSLYETGNGVPQDDKKAVAYYQASARHNTDDGQFRLALMVSRGRGGLPADPKEARRLMTLSAGQNYKPAKDWLAAHPTD